MKTHALIAILSLALLAACKQGPEPRYEGPKGNGRLVYQPGKGIVRKDSIASSDEAALYQAVEKAFTQGRMQDCVNLSEQLSLNFPEGSRVAEAIQLRIAARLALGRAQEGGLPRSVPLDRLLFLYLAPDDDPRLRELVARDRGIADYAKEFRANDFVDFIKRVAPDADAMYSSNQLGAALLDCRILITYYLPVQDLREFRHRTAELTRDIAWLAFAARSYNDVVEICDDLLALNPPPAVKGDTLFIKAHAQRLNGAHFIAAETFDRLYRQAGLRDTDTRWRPYALLWSINEIMDSSKGPIYDLVPYEHALELIGEYELYRIENPNLSDKLKDQFVILCERAYDVLILRDTNAADTYSRLGEKDARDQYLKNAKNWEAERDKRIARLRSSP